VDEFNAVLISTDLRASLLAAVRGRAPRKSFGYLISDRAANEPTDFIMFEDNIRNDQCWLPRFEMYGEYFVRHPGAGFVATPQESWRVQRQLLASGSFEVALFHSHHRHPGSFSQIDYDMHVSRFDNLWHMIISLRNPELPQLRAYDVSRAGVREREVRTINAPGTPSQHSYQDVVHGRSLS
jgi:proteasome lid subunit RPN8/RPN11